MAAESRAKSPKEAQRANADAMKAVLDRVKTLGLPGDAIRTSGYDLQPEFDYNNGRQTLRGYVARNSVEVRVDDITRAGDVLDAAVGSGATNVSGVRFDLKDRTAAEREALRDAVADARRRADSAAAGAGMKVDRVLRIEEHRSMGPNGSGKSTLARALAGHPEYEVTAGEVTYDGKDLLDMACESVRWRRR